MGTSITLRDLAASLHIHVGTHPAVAVLALVRSTPPASESYGVACTGTSPLVISGGFSFRSTHSSCTYRSAIAVD